MQIKLINTKETKFSDARLLKTEALALGYSPGIRCLPFMAKTLGLIPTTGKTTYEPFEINSAILNSSLR